MKIGVLGSGSWGTALAQTALDNGHEVLIWGVDQKELEDINQNHRNEKYFPNVALHKEIKATAEMERLHDSDLILLAVPSIAIESVCQQVAEIVEKPVIVINVAKGFHPVTHERMSVVIRRCMPENKLRDVVSLIGPSHAEEVVLRLLTSVNAVCENEAHARLVQEFFSNDYFRVYRNTDVIGAEIGVAVKNIMALASGILTGIGQGDNARAALMTRGLAEMARYGTYFGGRPETYLGLDGVGDLIVTCTSHHSRNFEAGILIGKNDSAEIFWKTNTKTVEGVEAAKVVYQVAKEKGISMPITEQIYQVLYQGKKPSEAIPELMARQLKSE